MCGRLFSRIFCYTLLSCFSPTRPAVLFYSVSSFLPSLSTGVLRTRGNQVRCPAGKRLMSCEINRVLVEVFDPLGCYPAPVIISLPMIRESVSSELLFKTSFLKMTLLLGVILCFSYFLLFFLLSLCLLSCSCPLTSLCSILLPFLQQF